MFDTERPVDTLARLLQQGPDAPAVQAFFTRHLPADQAIAVALLLATGRPDDLAHAATSAIFRHAGERAAPAGALVGDQPPSPLAVGLFRHVARLLGPVWKRPVQQLADAPVDLAAASAQLRALAAWMRRNAVPKVRPLPRPAPLTPLA